MSDKASERLQERLREFAEGTGIHDNPGLSLHCPHGVSSYLVCMKCEQRRWQAARELVLYDTLDRFSAAVERLADVLADKGTA